MTSMTRVEGGELITSSQQVGSYASSCTATERVKKPRTQLGAGLYHTGKPNLFDYFLELSTMFSIFDQKQDC